jgi:hypothetical protein
MQPINYGLLQTQVDLSPLRQGLQMRQNNQLQSVEAQQRASIAQLAREKFEYDQQQDIDYARDVEAWKAGGGTPEGLRDLALRHPDQSDRLLKAGDSYDAGHKKSMIETGFSTLGALQAGNIELAKKNLSDRAGALERAHIDSSHTRAALDMLNKGDVNGARSYISYAMSGLVGAEHTAGIMGELGIGARADASRRDDARADAQFEETKRHNRATEANTAADNVRADRASARADRKAAGGGSRGSKIPSGFIPD